MDHASQPIVIVSFLMLLSVLAGQVSNRLGAPVLLAFLGVGIFFGENGPGGIIFDDQEMAVMVCSVALGIILFDGGLRTPLRMFKMAFKPAFALSTVGVLITAVLTGGFAAWLVGSDWMHGLLVGSVVASTDAAAVFLLLHQRGIRLREKVTATLEAESGINDPMAVFLTISCVSFLTGEVTGFLPIMGLFFKQMGLGLGIGYAGGMGLSHLLRLVRLEAGLFPVVVLIGGLLIFSGTNLVGGSGFLAAYIAGITFANSGYQRMMLIKHFNDGIAWIAQLIMLLTLGLLVTPNEMLTYAVPGILIALFLIFIARPLAVYICLLRSSFNNRERLFISWVGLRGAIPIYLALIPALSGVEQGPYYFNVAFIIVLASLLLQGWTINPLARKLGITEAGNGANKD